VLSVGAIGFRNHAARVIACVEATGRARVDVVLHPSADAAATGRRTVRDVEALRACDAVLVLSPNDTHAGYLAALADGYRGYVFCEKPPVARPEEIQLLERLDPARTFFDFNLRFSRFAELASDARLGKVVSADATVTHGLAFRPHYPGSWRADPSKHGRGLFESVAVHFVDLFAWLAGPVARVTHVASSVAGTGGAPDTCRVLLEHAGGATSSILASYAAPAATRLALLGTEGALVQERGRVTLGAPRDTFDARGRFAEPPVVLDETAEDPFEASLQRSVDHFIARAAAGQAFDPALFDASVATTRHLVGA